MIASSADERARIRHDRQGALAVPNVLLVSGVSPGIGCVGEIILSDLCAAYPFGRICCFAIPGAKLLSTPDPRLRSVPVRHEARPRERPRRLLGGPLGALSAFVYSAFHFERYVTALVSRAVDFGARHGAEKVWMVLDAPTLIAIGPRIATRLKIPLLALVWDPPEYLMQQAGMDRFTRGRLLKRFGETLRQAERVAVVSEAMAEEYHRLHNAECVIMRHGLAPAARRAAQSAPTSKYRFNIGFAGSLYAHSAWAALIRALEALEWKLGGRQVCLRVLGESFHLRSRGAAHIEYLGWRSNHETVRILASCDVNYLPQPFESHLRDLARYSFPTKLSTYVATGRPVFVHAPPYASLTSYVKKHPIGPSCQSLELQEMASRLERLATDEGLYSGYAKASAEVGSSDFAAITFHNRFAEFIGVEPSTTGMDRERAL